MATAIGSLLRAALASGDDMALTQITNEIVKLSPQERLTKVILPLPSGETWAEHFAAAARKLPQQKSRIWRVLQAMTDIRPPPLEEFMTHFGQASLLSVLISSLSANETKECLIASCNCIRNLGRIPRIRAMLDDSVGPLVETISQNSSEITGAVAAALCNVSCTVSGKEQAVNAGAVPQLLLSLSKESCAHIADDIVASLGVLTGGFPRGAEAVIESQLGVTPIVRCLSLGCPIPAATALDVLCDLTLAAGPTSYVASQLVADKRLVSHELPQLLGSSEAPVRGTALKLCALLLEMEGFRAAFTHAGGAQALRECIELEPFEPSTAGFLTPGQLHAGPTACTETARPDFSSIGRLASLGRGLRSNTGTGNQPRSRRQIAQQLLSQL
eukprot:TRINITY_DN27689_c0_g2_i1.p1 TRINITY_DN27689_c0_g2~~TRINITY_DN27689_c0_g2_i1.p1  ORF type:complete len:403 (+),score=56.23 TRINITY_DN27689_c0_g2_i1:49-1209(+)